MLINQIDSKIHNSTNFRAKPPEFKLSKGVVATVLDFPENTSGITEKLKFGDPFYVVRHYSATEGGRNFTEVLKGEFQTAERQKNGDIFLNNSNNPTTVTANDNLFTKDQFIQYRLNFLLALGELNKILE